MSSSVRAPQPSLNIPNSLPVFWNESSWHIGRRGPTSPKSLTFTAIGGDLGKRVVTAITLTPNDTRFAWTLAILRITDSGQRTSGVTITQETSGAARGPVVILLGGEEGSLDQTYLSWMLVNLSSCDLPKESRPYPGPCGHRIQHSQQQVMSWS